MGQIFGTTRWTRVLRAGRGADATGREALEDLCRAYWPALHAYLRARGHAEEDAADLVQGYFESLLAREGLGKVTPEGGRFRDWLLAGLRNHTLDEHDRSRTLKRGEGRIGLPLDSPDPELGAALAAESDPARVFELRWATLVLDRARERVLASWTEAPEEREAFLPVLSGEPPDRGALRALGLSPVAIRVRSHRLRARLRDAVLEELRGTLGPGENADRELDELFGALARSVECSESA